MSYRLKKSAASTLSSLLALLLLLQPLAAAVPQRILYQGTLRQTGGLYTGSAAFLFRITDSSGGVEYWSSGSTVVAVTAGLFRYPLGADNPGTGGVDESASFLTIDWSNIAPYVEVTVNGDLLSPREEIHSVPYAIFNSAATDMVNPRVLRAGDAMTGQLTIAGSTLTVTGSAFSVGGSTLAVKDGRLGIGVTAPQTPLHIENNGASLVKLVNTAVTANGWGIRHLAGNILAVTDNQSASDRMYFDGSGNVGIGPVSAPLSRLHVLNGDIRVSTEAGQPSRGVIFQDGTTLLTAGGANAWAMVDASSVASAVAGNVGIGTTHPDVKLHVAGNMHVDTSGTSSLTRNVTFKSGGSALDWASYGGGWAPGLMLQGSTPAGADSASEFLFLSALDDTQAALIASGKDLEIYTGAPLGSSGSRSLYLGGTGNLFLGVDAGRVHAAANGTFVGYQAGYNNTTGSNNTFLGGRAGRADTTGSDNVSVGMESGLTNAAGNSLTLLGFRAGYSNTGSSNTFAGYLAGYSNTSGRYNVSVGNRALYGNWTGDENTAVGYQAGESQLSTGVTFLGYQAGRANTTGAGNTCIGRSACQANTTTDYGTFVGYSAGISNTASYNTFIGFDAGYSNTSGANNAFLGFYSGYTNSAGTRNTYIGTSAGYSATGSDNTFLGQAAGYSTSSGGQNTVLGSQAGLNLGTGAGNVLLGYMAGYNETGSNKLYIDNSNTASPLIGGNFSTNEVSVNGVLGVGTTDPNESFRLDVRGTILVTDATAFEGGIITHSANGLLLSGVDATKAVILAINGTEKARLHSSGRFGVGTDNPNDGMVEVKGGSVCVDTNSDDSATSCVANESDERLKREIEPITGAVEKLKRLRGVTFDWRWDEFEQVRRFKALPHSMGLIAQDVEKVFPAAMNEEIGVYKSVNYNALVGALVEAVKEQQAEIDSLQEKVRLLEKP
ncbi:MAG: tail fiber domain-containing protein [Elusimicrobiota bacterium]|jgi:hypothetical protein